jgi:hypothetical protein
MRYLAAALAGLAGVPSAPTWRTLSDAMPLPVTLTVAYLTLNLTLMVLLELERSQGRPPSPRMSVLAGALRFGPPLLGLLYLVTIAGDWLFLGFVAAFFAIGFWLMDGLLAYTNPGSTSEAMRSGWDDRGTAASPKTDRDRT